MRGRGRGESGPGWSTGRGLERGAQNMESSIWEMTGAGSLVYEMARGFQT